MNECLRIGFVLDDSLDKTDGVQQYVLALGAWLQAQGHVVHYLVGQTERRDLPRVHSLARNVAVRFNGNRMSMPLPASRAAIRALLRQEALDVLHVQMPYSPFMAARIVRLAPRETAVVGTFHIAPDSALVSAATRALGLWLHASLRRFDTALSVSKAAQTFALQAFGIDSTVVPNVIDYRRFHTAKPLKRYKDGKLTILFLGRLVPRKGCKLLLDAVSRLLAAEPALRGQLRVVICGTGPLEPQLREYCRQQLLEKVVEFAGYVSEADKPRYYASADIAVFPSSGGESFGIVLLEAMASGRAAVLAGNNPGYASVLQERPDALFDPVNPKSLARKLAELVHSKAKADSLRIWGGHYAAQFDTATVGTRLVSIYEEALRRRRNMP